MIKKLRLWLHDLKPRIYNCPDVYYIVGRGNEYIIKKCGNNYRFRG